MSDLELVQRVYREFGTAPLTPEQNDLYVSLDDVRGGENMVSKLAKAHCSGGRKSDVPRFLRDTREAASQPKSCGSRSGSRRMRGMFVVYVQLSDSLDLYDVQFPEVLIANGPATCRGPACNRAGMELKPNYFTNRLKALGKLLDVRSRSGVFRTEYGHGKGGLATQGQPGYASQIRRAFDPAAASWLDAANDVIGQAVSDAGREKGRTGPGIPRRTTWTRWTSIN